MTEDRSTTEATATECPSEDPRQNFPVCPGRRILCPKTDIIYELGEQIGSGAAAVVYKCRQVLPSTGSLPERLDKVDIAAKVMDLRGLRLRTDFQREREKLRREVSILSQLHHPCIVNLLHVIETKDELFLIMELVKGGELFYQIIEKGALTEDQARYVLIQIISALQYMHGKGIIHRDLKPENILVSSEPAPGFYRVKVADFGLAKLIQQGISEAKTFVGTPQYWAPEVIDSSTRNQVYGPEADLWSLGCVIYVMLGGAYPFDNRLGPIDTLIKNAQYHFRYPRFQRVSSDAKDMIRGLLTVDPQRRMTLQQILQHSWITSYKLPPSVQPLPDLHPLASVDFLNDLQISTRSILGPTPSFRLEMPFKYSREPLEKIVSMKCPESATRVDIKARKQTDRTQPDSEATSDAVSICNQVSNEDSSSIIQSKLTDQQDVGRLEMDERFADPISRIIKPQNREIFQSRHNQDRPDDPNTKAIVVAYAPWRPSPYPQQPMAPGYWYPPPQPYYQQNWIENQNQPPQMTPLGNGYPYWTPAVPMSQQTACPSYFVNEASQPSFKPNNVQDRYAEPTSSSDDSTSGTPDNSLKESKVVHATDTIYSSYLYKSPLVASPHEGGRNLGRPKCEDAVRAAESLFNFDELLELQIYIMRKFHWAYIALRRCPNIGKLLRNSIREVQDIQGESVEVIRRFETTCASVLGVLPDLSLAVKERQHQLAIDIFEDIRTMVSELKTVVELHQSKLRTFVSHVADLVEDIQSIKVSSDRRFITAAANLPRLCNGERSEFVENFHGRVRFVDSNSRVHLGKKEKNTRNQDNAAECSAMTLDAETNTVFEKWYGDVRNAVLEQLETLVGKAVENMKDNDKESYNEKGIACIAHDLLDLLFISPSSWQEHQRVIANRRCLKDEYGDRRRSKATLKTRNRQRDDRVEFLHRSRSYSNPDSTRTGSHDSYLNNDKEQDLSDKVSETAPVTDGENDRVTDGEDTTKRKQNQNDHRRLPQWRLRHECGRHWRARQQLYSQALKTSEILVRALDDVRRVDEILRQSASFWLNFILVIDRLCKMKTHTERLLQYSSASPEFAGRFFERLNDYRDFWTALRDQSHRYVVEAGTKIRTLQEFALALETTADRADTVNALHFGQHAALMGN